MHGRETGADPVKVPSLDVLKELELDWEMEVRMSKRARTALEFMRIAVERYGDEGELLWPIVPSSLYGVFLAGDAKVSRIPVITFDASVDGWGAAVPHRRRGAQKSSASIVWPLPFSGGRSLIQRRFLRAQHRRCTGRRWRDSSPRGPPASSTLWRIAPS
jgi:hypothetical protein